MQTISGYYRLMRCRSVPIIIRNLIKIERKYYHGMIFILNCRYLSYTFLNKPLNKIFNLLLIPN